MSIRSELKKISIEKQNLESGPREKNLVSVCVPNYNKGMFLKEALESIACQNYKDIELLFVDDNSTDLSLQVFKRFAFENNKRFRSIKSIFLDRRVGNAWATNMAYYLSKGEFIAQMDSDDISSPERIDKQVLHLKENNLDLVGTNFSTVSIEKRCVKNEDGGHWLKFSEEEIQDSYEKSVHCVCFGTILFKYYVLEELGGLNRSLVGTEDWEFIDRVYQSGYRIGNLRETLYTYRMHPNQRSKLFHKQ